MKRLVILDLDLTLIHSMTKKTSTPEAFTLKLLKSGETYYVHKRRYLNQFINELKTLIHKYPKFKVAIWTAIAKVVSAVTPKLVRVRKSAVPKKVSLYKFSF